MKRRYLTLLLLSALSGSSEAADMLALRQAEKVSMTLTGRPLPDAMRKDYLAGKIKIDGIADALSRDPQFIEYFAQYWARTMGFQTPFNAYDIRIAKGNESLDSVNFRRYSELISAKDAAQYDVKRLTELSKNVSGPMQVVVKFCDDAPMAFFSSNPEAKAFVINAATNGIGPDGNPVLAGTQDLWKAMLPVYQVGEMECNDPALKTVTPWWDPETEVNSRYAKGTPYKAPPLVLERCGANLDLCNSTSTRDKDVFMDNVNMDMMMEPSYIIAHTVAEDRPYSDIVAGTDTIMTGAYGAFMARMGTKFWDNFPGGAYDDAAGHAIFVTSNAADRKHYRIKRNANHAGILTTPAYQLLTNGRRAKANRAYETLLCKKFSVPEGAQANPADANPDLTKRAYCTFCHKSLEPMAAFFNRWPTTGVRNYLYDKDPTINDSGRFNGQDGKGAAAFGKIIADNETFGECAVKRAFEFVNGRPMSIIERDNKLSTYVTQFKGSSMNLRQVIRAMVLAPEFLTPKGE